MNADLQHRLFDDFPELFRRNDGCFWGFECGDGWFDLIRDLATKLTKVIEKSYPDNKDRPFVTQVKEKYGLLRVYMSDENEEIINLIQKYELKSGTVCDLCGRKGQVRGNGYYETRCDKHKYLR